VLPYVDDRAIRRETAGLLKRIRSVIPAEARTVARLSGGQRQAVAIARAIYWQAKVVLMDEPTAALAVMERERVIEHARELAAHGVGVIYIGHNLTEILKVADRIAVMFRGRTVHVTAAGDTTQETLIKYMTGYSETEKAA
jgi:ABC-type sugar transport system ATPase subunit